MRKQKNLFEKIIQKLTHTMDTVPKDLPDYQVVVIGNTVGGVLTKNLSHFTHGHKDIMFISNTKTYENTHLRPLYEQKRIDKIAYNLSVPAVVCKSVAKPDHALKAILPHKNQVELQNGRLINYQTLVLEPGLLPSPGKIQGFQEALNTFDCPVYTTYDPSVPLKYCRTFSLFEHGNAFVYIPEFPMANEVECYNFLLSLDLWRFNEKVGLGSPLYKLTVINANDRLASTCEKLNSYLTEAMAKFPKAEILYNTKLVEIDGPNRKLVLQDKNGISTSKDFDYAYVHVPSEPNPIIKEAGLEGPNPYKVPVNPKSLQHVNFDNIYAYGEGCDVEVQGGFLASIAQSHVVRHNVLEQIENRRPNAEYDNYSKIPLYLGIGQMGWYESSNSKGVIISDNWPKLRYYLMRKSGIKKMMAIYNGKKGGPEAKKFKVFPKGEQVGPVVTHAHH